MSRALTVWLLVVGVDAPKWQFMKRMEIGVPS
jgi:hypothetical protein